MDAVLTRMDEIFLWRVSFYSRDIFFIVVTVDFVLVLSPALKVSCCESLLLKCVNKQIHSRVSKNE